MKQKSTTTHAKQTKLKQTKSVKKQKANALSSSLTAPAGMNVLVSFWTIVHKEIMRILRIWTQTLLPPVITMSLYFVIFGSLIGSQVEGVGTYTYIQFIVPGIIMMAVIMNAYSNTSSSFFGNKFQRSIEELVVSPTPSWVIVLGYVAGGMFRGLAVGFIVTLVSLLFTKLHVFNILILILFVTLTAFVFSLAGFINGLLARKFDDVAIVPTFVLTPLTYLGGVFYSISMLPQFWQHLALANPVLYMVNGFRYGFLGMSDINVFAAAVMLVFFAVILFYAALVMLKKGIGLRN